MARPSTMQAVLFDFDGTLADTEPFTFDGVRSAFSAHGIELSDEELHSIPGSDGVQPVYAIFDAHGIERPDIDEFWGGESSIDWIYHEATLVLEEGASELVDDLLSRKIAVGVVSSTERRNVEAALGRLGLADRLPALVCAAEAGAFKPDPAPYLRACALLGADPSACVVFEDSPLGIAAAKAAGAYVIGYKGCSVPLDTSAADEELFSFADARL